MKKYLLTILALVFLSCLSASVASQEESGSADPKVVGVLFYADWCGSCKVLEPKLNKVKKDFMDQPVLFTRFDLTDDFTRQQSKLYANLIDMQNIYTENAGKTGFMLLVNPKDKRVLGKLIKTQSEQEIKATIQTALKN